LDVNIDRGAGMLWIQLGKNCRGHCGIHQGVQDSPMGPTKRGPAEFRGGLQVGECPALTRLFLSNTQGVVQRIVVDLLQKLL